MKAVFYAPTLAAAQTLQVQDPSNPIRTVIILHNISSEETKRCGMLVGFIGHAFYRWVPPTHGITL